MNKKELIAAVAEVSGVSKKDAEAVIKATFGTIASTMAQGEKVSVNGFGTFETRKREARTGKNPRTGKEVSIAACQVPTFKAGKALKEEMNK